MIDIPVWIINRDRLTTTRNMVEYLHRVPGARPIIFDMESSYPPLLEWYKTFGGHIVRSENVGPRDTWNHVPDISLGCDYYVVTDSDLDLSSVPLDVLDFLRSGLDRYPRIHKCGLSLEINDLPNTEMGRFAFRCEESYWWHRVDGQFFNAGIDTTFAMYRAGSGWAGDAIRSDRPYTARHVPWYGVIDAEEQYYKDHADLRFASLVCKEKTGKTPWGTE